MPLGRSYGLHAWPFCQNWAQLVDIYGESGAESFLASCDAFCVYGLDDPRTPQLVSDFIGRITPSELGGFQTVKYGDRVAFATARHSATVSCTRRALAAGREASAVGQTGSLDHVRGELAQLKQGLQR
ncbi:hypothetical protein CNY89_24535, partial [Amaricoccus sp. HAR-UPW-R2A-40]